MIIALAVAVAMLLVPSIAAAAPGAPSWLGVYFVRTDSAYGQKIDTYCYGSANFTNRSGGVWYQAGGKWKCEAFQWRTGSAGTFHRWGTFNYTGYANNAVNGSFDEESGWGSKLADTARPPSWMNVYYARSDNAYGQRIDTYCIGSAAFTDRASGVWAGSIYGYYCNGFQWSTGYSGTFHRKGLFNYNATRFFEKGEWSPRLA